MKFVLLSLIAFCFFSCAFAAIATFTYVNVSTTNPAFAARFSNAGKIDIPGIASGAQYSSLSITASNGTADVNGVHGSAFQLIGFSPVASLSYFDVNTKYTPGSQNQPYNFDVAGAASYVGHLFAGVQEIDTNGNIVNYEPFKVYLWKISNISSSTDIVKYVTLCGKRLLNSNTLVVELTFVIPPALINLSINSAYSTMVSPKGLEVIVAIDASNYNYKSQSNFLRLVSFTATGSASIQGNVKTGINGAKTLIQGGSGAGAITVRYVPQAIVGNNGATVNVAVNIQATTNFSNIDVGDIVTQVKAKYAASASVFQATVDFPAGATTIVYDPTLTSGEDPAVTSSASGVVPTLFVFLACLILFFFN